jgi:hypothetical protein
MVVVFMDKISFEILLQVAGYKLLRLQVISGFPPTWNLQPVTCNL